MDQSVAHYRVLKRLGAGGMGEVYKAEDLKLRRTVALKLLPPEMLTDPAATLRLLNEARAAATLNHPHIATIYELGQADSLPYMAMEYVEGETLAQKIAHGPLEISPALDIAIQVAEALKAAHARRLIHCDIKSSNIMLTSDGDVKVLDFGLARPGVAQVGDWPYSAIAGTASFMSPQQARGEPLDVGTDLFSLGLVLYEMVTGRQPFEGANCQAVLHAILNDEPPALRLFRNDVPMELESIVRKALEKNRDERYQSAGDLLFDLRQLRTQLEPQSHREHRDGSRTLDYPLKPSVPSVTLWLNRLLSFVRRKAASPISSLPKGAAFRGLLPFQEADRDRFYGRELDTLALFEMIAHNEFRFGVLFGDSGCGKTSLVRAGLLPKLWDEGYVPIYCRSYKDPLAAILQECRKRSQIMYGGPSVGPRDSSPGEGRGRPETDAPTDYLRRVAGDLNATLVIVCDQFEEFFVNFRTKREREPFISLVAECYHTANLPVKFLFSMRSDFLYLINSEFAGRIPEPLLSSRLYHLPAFGQEQAEEIIEKSVQRANLPFEPGLSRQVARDLADGNSVLPSELQIVGEQLQTKRIFTLQGYRRAGGKEQLVSGFLEDVVQASGDQDVARLMLRSLVSDENTRLALPLDEIAKRTQRSRDTVARVLSLFVQARLIHELQDEEPWRYELVHDYLIEKVNQITGRVMDATQRANRLFRQYLSSYSVDKGTRIPIRDLWRIRRYSDVAAGERERELLRKSLRWGLLKAGALVVLLAVVTTLAAAALSLSDEWEGARLSDGHTAAVRRAVFSPDGRLLVSVGEDAKVIVWDFARRERLATLTDHTDVVSSVAFSPDGKWFATRSYDRTVIVWDASSSASWQLAPPRKAAILHGHRGKVNAIAFSPDGRWLVSASDAPDWRTIVWEVGRWKKVRELSISGIGYGTLLFSPNGRWLMAPAGSTWDVTTGQQVADYFDPIRGSANWAALSPDTTRLVGVDGEGIVSFWDLTRFWDLSRRKLLGRYRVYRDHGRAVAYSPDGRLVATGAEDIILWDAATQTKLVRLEHAAIVWGLEFSPDGRWLVSTHGDGAILLWDVTERERVANLNEHSGPVRAVAFSRDGKQLASASEDRSVIIWNAESGRKEAVLIGHDIRVNAAAFSPDGKSVASSDQDGNVIFWDVAQRQPRWTAKYLHPVHKTRYPVIVWRFPPTGGG